MIRDLIMAAAGGKRGPVFVADRAYRQNTTGYNFSVGLPLGYQPGDLLVVILAAGGLSDGASTTWGVPAGWTKAYDQGGGVNMAVAWKIADGTEGAGALFYTVNSSRYHSCYAAAFRGAAFDRAGLAAYTPARTVTIPAVLVDQDNSTLMAMVYQADMTAGFSVPAGMTLTEDASSASTAPNFDGFMQEGVSAGTAASRTSTSEGGTRYVGGIMVSIKGA